MKIAFLGTSAFAVPALKALAEAGHDVAAVYTRAPKPAGRGQQERRTPVHELALSLGLTVHSPRSLRNDEEAQAFRAFDLDAAVVVSYGHILPKSFLDAPVLGCINIHGSLLPRWRGAAPIHRAILAGDSETGVTTMRMDEGLDTGPMLLAESTPISSADTAETVHDRLAELGARLIDASAKQMADAFFDRFAAQVASAEAEAVAAAPSAPASVAPAPVAPAPGISLLDLIPREPGGLPIVAWIGIAVFIPVAVLLLMGFL